MGVNELFVVSRNDFLSYLESEPRVAVKLIALLCQRIRWASDRFEESVLLPLQARLARRICALATDFGSEVHISRNSWESMWGRRAKALTVNCSNGNSKKFSKYTADVFCR